MHEAYRLDRMYPLLDRLGNPQNKFKAIHVAGTSGKTSTSYYLAAMLHAAGRKVGLTVSPHVEEINERVQLNLVPLPEQIYCQLFTEFMDLIDGLHTKPTYFELLVAFAYWIFAREGVEYAVIEVGLGGLLDSTNVITRADKVCVITDLGIDHTHILGRTLPEIAAQKAGIIRTGNAVYMYKQNDIVMRVIREVCDQQRAELVELTSKVVPRALRKLPLFQRRNWSLARAVVEYVLQRDNIGLPTRPQLESSGLVYIPGRMEVLRFGEKTLILDGAHNGQKMQALIKSVKAEFPGTTFAVLFGMTRSKSSRLDAALDALIAEHPHIIITSFDSKADGYRTGLSALKIAQYCHLKNYDNWETVGDSESALNTLMERPEKVLVVTGSLYLLGYIRPFLGKYFDTPS
jgi:dihydrofolate synthase/folylpolyglutamate synthase